MLQASNSYADGFFKSIGEGLDSAVNRVGGVVSDIEKEIIFKHQESRNKERVNTEVVVADRETTSKGEVAKKSRQINVDASSGVKKTTINGYREVEPNNDFSRATQLSENDFYKAALSNPTGRYDVDFYKIIMKKKGVLTIAFNPDHGCDNYEFGGGDNYTVYLIDGAVESLIGRESANLLSVHESSNGFKRTIGLNKGVYFVKVRSDNRCTQKKGSYSIAYTAKPTEYAEVEPNNGYDFATAIKVNDNGYIGRIQNVFHNNDFYSFEILEKTTISIIFKQPNYEAEKVSFSVSIKGNDKKHKRISYFKNLNAKSSQNILKLDKGKYFIFVRGRVNSNRSDERIKGIENLEYEIRLSKNIERKPKTELRKLF